MYPLPTNYDALSPRERQAVREQYVEQQKGLCYHCKGPIEEFPLEPVASMYVDLKLFPEGFFRDLVHLHHSHATGLTIGAVHAKCNAVLWQYHGE